MPRQFDFSITPANVAESLPHRVSDSSEVAFQDNGILLGRRNLVRVRFSSSPSKLRGVPSDGGCRLSMSSCVIAFLLFKIFPPPFSPWGESERWFNLFWFVLICFSLFCVPNVDISASDVAESVFDVTESAVDVTASTVSLSASSAQLLLLWEEWYDASSSASNRQ